MKKIFACIRNKEHMEKLSAFCEQERLTLVHSEASAPSESESPVFFITDDKTCREDLGSCAAPLCIISDDKPEAGVYYLKEGFNICHLRMLIDSIYHGSFVSNYAPSLVPKVISKEYVIENDYNNIDRIVCAITAELPFFFSFSDLEKVRVGISEMITNAIEHGNLAITSQEKMESTENGTYYALLNKRLENPQYAGRRTSVSLDCRDGVLTVRIKDGGSGFDTSKIPDPTDTERLLKLHGRGIFITRMYFNEIRYNDKGNEVTLVKRVN